MVWLVIELWFHHQMKRPLKMAIEVMVAAGFGVMIMEIAAVVRIKKT